MTDTIITVENLSKRYRLGVIGATTFKESVERAWHRVRGRDPVVEMGKVGQGSKVARLQGCKVARWERNRVARWQGGKVARWEKENL